MTQKVKVASKIYFNKFRVYNYTDGTYSFEDYPPYFEGVIEAITWGRAYQEAEKQIAEGQKKIAELQEQTAKALVGVKWAPIKVSY
jgi:hypothetical protein